ncbi:MAG: Unknown protein [uncultured Sulfurovum sp.]|uniref:Uncharacterized protein n=1 Tax=uncultured Sulfurovum sp. TaxID=269237 RepID=A0A6S6TV89_9BACT|nr:MAG: Unknown protein [uncultured Sulfurovum sp.]
MNIGKVGEAKMAQTFGKMAEVEDKVDFKKPSFTNAPDNGVDFELQCPHNYTEKIDEIIKNGTSEQQLSTTTITIRIDHKEYKGKIGKATAEKFVKDCDKNEGYDEHWLTGAKGLTTGAEKVLKEANKDFICRHYTQEKINTIDNFYTNEIENSNDNEID